MNKQGIDVSKWQPKVDWKKVKADGIDFAIIRIGYCSTTTVRSNSTVPLPGTSRVRWRQDWM